MGRKVPGADPKTFEVLLGSIAKITAPGSANGLQTEKCSSACSMNGHSTNERLVTADGPPNSVGRVSSNAEKRNSPNRVRRSVRRGITASFLSRLRKAAGYGRVCHRITHHARLAWPLLARHGAATSRWQEVGLSRRRKTSTQTNSKYEETKRHQSRSLGRHQI